MPRERETAAPTVAPPEPLPQQGGSYVRAADGTLTQVAGSDADPHQPEQE